MMFHRSKIEQITLVSTQYTAEEISSLDKKCIQFHPASCQVETHLQVFWLYISNFV